MHALERANSTTKTGLRCVTPKKPQASNQYTRRGVGESDLSSDSSYIHRSCLAIATFVASLLRVSTSRCPRSATATQYASFPFSPSPTHTHRPLSPFFALCLPLVIYYEAPFQLRWLCLSCAQLLSQRSGSLVLLRSRLLRGITPGGAFFTSLLQASRPGGRPGLLIHPCPVTYGCMTF